MLRHFELEKHVDKTKDKPYMLEFKLFPNDKELQVKILNKYDGGYIVARHIFKRKLFRRNVDHWSIGLGYRRFFKGKYYSVPFALHQVMYFDNEKECDLVNSALNVYLDNITKEQHAGEIVERVYQKVTGSPSTPSSGRVSRSERHASTDNGMWYVGVNTSDTDNHQRHHHSNDSHHDSSPSYDSGSSSGDTGGGCD